MVKIYADTICMLAGRVLRLIYVCAIGRHVLCICCEKSKAFLYIIMGLLPNLVAVKQSILSLWHRGLLELTIKRVRDILLMLIEIT